MKKEGKKLLLKDFLETDEDNIPFHLDVVMENVMDGNKGTTIAHLDNLIYDVFQVLPKMTVERTLFRFIGLSSKNNDWKGDECYAFNDIKNNALTFAAPKLFNDPMDPLIKAWAEWRKIQHTDKVDKVLYKLISDVLDRIRICCLVDPLRNRIRPKEAKIDDCSPLMWAHYANNHKGICIQYRVKPENIIDGERVVLRLLDVNYDKPFPLDGNIPFVDSLCVKGDYWRYEKETRLIMYVRGNIAEHQPMKGFEIEAIYMGYKIEHEKRDYLIKMLKSSDIKLYQMDFDKRNMTKMVAHLVN